MTHLTDMEELLSTVLSDNVRDYMREAMNCYFAGAYRGCIVLSYIALFDDLFDRLSELGKINKTAKTLSQDLEKQKDAQKVFESTLIDKLGSTKILPSLDTFILKTIRDLRNKSAHPSGHKPSPEEARFIFFETINRFLSQPILTTQHLVDQLIERLKNKNFFPTNVISDISEVVEEEIRKLDQNAYSMLIEKLSENFTSSEENIPRNASFFLLGLASLNQPEVNALLQKIVIQAKSDDQNYFPLVAQLISSNGKLITDLSNVCVQRIKKIFSERIDNVKAYDRETEYFHPIAIFVSLSRALSDDELVDTYSDELLKLFKHKPYSNYLIDSLEKLPKVCEIYLNEIKKKAGSDNFDEANQFAREINALDGNLVKITSDKDAFEIVVSVLKAARRNAYDAQWLRDIKFSKIPKIKSAAQKYLNENASAAKEYIRETRLEDLEPSAFIDRYFDSEALA